MKKRSTPRKPNQKTQVRPIKPSVLNLEETIEVMEKLLETVNFDELDKQLAVIDWHAIPASNQLSRLRVNCLRAEACDYFGRYKDADDSITPDAELCNEVIEGLEEGNTLLPADDNARRLLKQQVWVLIHWAYTFYRRNNTGRALELLERCKRVMKHVITDANPSHLTLSRICYARGLCYRQNYDYIAAKVEFGAAMDSAWRAMGTTHQPELINYTIAKCLSLGLGWICYTEGRVEAEPLLIAARTFLEAVPDERMIKAYVDVVHACIQRSAHGNTHEQLDKTVGLLQKSHDMFAAAKHELYRARAANELALAHVQKAFLYSARSQERMAALGKADKYTAEIEGFGMKVNALIIRSRIKRHLEDYPAAHEIADEAVREAGDDRFSKIDALIALGEACLELGASRYPAALDAFYGALKEAGNENIKVRAVCCLHLARTYLRENKMREAREQFNNWQLVQALVATAFVQDLGKKVEEDLKKASDDFYLAFSDASLKIEGFDRLGAREIELLLHAWLCKWARHHNPQAPWALLGIGQAGFRVWERNERDFRQARAGQPAAR